MLAILTKTKIEKPYNKLRQRKTTTPRLIEMQKCQELTKLQPQATKSNIDQIPNIANYVDKSSLRILEGNSANQSNCNKNALRNDDNDAASSAENGALANPV